MMKNNYLKSLVWIALAVVGFSCEDKEDGPRVQPVDLSLHVVYSSDFNGQSADEVNVTLTNVTSQQVYDGITDASGQLLLEGVPSGTYDIIARKSYTASEFEAFAGVSTDQEEVVFNASQSGFAITTATSAMTLTLESGRVGDLVIKQVYNSGSDRVEGALFRDQFVEIYNNSNDTIYVDGLYVMGALGKTSEGTGAGYLSNGQYDWAQSIGMVATDDANENYLYAKWIYQFPGTGEDYPVYPGKSIIVAQTAVNHKAPFTGNKGEAVTVINPDLTVDLSGADFEVYLAEDGGSPLESDINNPDVPNMNNIFSFGRDFILDNPGREAVAIFRSETDVLSFPAYATPNVTEIKSTTKLYFQIPADLILDAVEIQPSPTNQVPRKLATSLDATYTYVPGGSYSSQSVIRKTSKTFGDRVVLMDTNNSEADFGYFEVANPRGFLQ